MIKFNDYGVAAPTTSTRSLGTKLVLYPGVNATKTDYAIGIEDYTLWFSVPSSGDKFKFYGGTTEIFRINGNGKVGIGTSSPEYSLEAYGINASLITHYLGQSKGGIAALASNKFALFTTAADDDIIFGYTSTDQTLFGTSFVETMRVDNGNQRVGIGVKAPANTLEVNGIAAKTGGGSWSVLSDARLKDIHGNYTRGISEIMKLRAVAFNYKEGNPKGYSSKENYVGFVAQDVQKVFPEAVKMDSDGYLNFDIHPINVAMVNAFQEQQKEIEQVKNENQQLKTELDNLKVELEAIKALLKK